SLADAVVALYERDLEEMGRVARARVLRRFTWNQAFNNQIGIYASLFGARQRHTIGGAISRPAT
ncbi:MAG TPA: hypothetical protein VMT29_07565, partial [Steroidobacteraceae bacterium]|nr:hypothetical protein [Steroidobacteraceae bacterium]